MGWYPRGEVDASIGILGYLPPNQNRVDHLTEEEVYRRYPAILEADKDVILGNTGPPLP